MRKTFVDVMVPLRRMRRVKTNPFPVALCSLLLGLMCASVVESLSATHTQTRTPVAGTVSVLRNVVLPSLFRFCDPEPLFQTFFLLL